MFILTTTVMKGIAAATIITCVILSVRDIIREYLDL